MTTRPAALEYEAQARGRRGLVLATGVTLVVGGAALAVMSLGFAGYVFSQIGLANAELPAAAGVLLMFGGLFGGLAAGGGLFIAGGAGLLRHRPWGRPLAAGALVGAVVGGVGLCGLMLASLAQQVLRDPSWIAESPSDLVVLVIVATLLVALPLAMLWCLRRAGDEAETAARPGGYWARATPAVLGLALLGLTWGAALAAVGAGSLLLMMSPMATVEPGDSAWRLIVTGAWLLTGGGLALGRWRAGPIVFLVAVPATAAWSWFDALGDRDIWRAAETAAWAVPFAVLAGYAFFDLGRPAAGRG